MTIKQNAKALQSFGKSYQSIQMIKVILRTAAVVSTGSAGPVPVGWDISKSIMDAWVIAIIINYTS